MCDTCISRNEAVVKMTHYPNKTHAYEQCRESKRYGDMESRQSVDRFMQSCSTNLEASSELLRGADAVGLSRAGRFRS